MAELNEMLDNIKHFTDCYENIPNDFDVHADYLIDGMTKEEFIKGYIEYQKLMVALHDELYQNPNEYGLTVYDKKTDSYKPAYAMGHPILWLMVSLSQAGEIKNDILYVNGEVYKEYVGGKAIGSHDGTPKNVDKLITILSKCGIEVEEYCHNEAKDFTVAAPSNPRLMTAIKASTLPQYSKKSLMSDYRSFNYRLYSIGMKEKFPFELTHTYSLMNEKYQKFMSELLAEIAKAKIGSPVIYHHNTDGGLLNFKNLLLYYNLEGPRFGFQGNENVYKNRDYFLSMPEPYRSLWETAMKCRGCRQGECRYRNIVESDGKKTVYCMVGGASYPRGYDYDVAHIIEILTILKGKK